MKWCASPKKFQRRMLIGFGTGEGRKDPENAKMMQAHQPSWGTGFRGLEACSQDRGSEALPAVSQPRKSSSNRVVPVSQKALVEPPLEEGRATGRRHQEQSRPPRPVSRCRDERRREDSLRGEADPGVGKLPVRCRLPVGQEGEELLGVDPVVAPENPGESRRRPAHFRPGRVEKRVRHGVDAGLDLVRLDPRRSRTTPSRPFAAARRLKPFRRLPSAARRLRWATGSSALARNRTTSSPRDGAEGSKARGSRTFVRAAKRPERVTPIHVPPATRSRPASRPSYPCQKAAGSEGRATNSSRFAATTRG